jgi:hypothetical protein
MSGRLSIDLHTLRARGGVAALALLAFLATTAVPRRPWYAHDHAADATGHVHTGHAASARDAEDEWSLLLEESVRHGHDHHHGDASAHAGHRHGGDTRWGQGAARGSRDRSDDAGRAFVSPGAARAAHAHWQDPFQHATAPAALALDVRLSPLPARQTPDPRLRCAAPVALRARSPPPVLSV